MNCDGRFDPSYKDSQYRRKVEEAVRNSRVVIEILGTNLHHINYPEIMYSIKEARRSGVVVSVYFTKGSERLIGFLKQSDVELYKGENMFSDEDYIAIDGAKLIASKLENNKRIGYWTTSQYKNKDVLDKFDSICENAERINSMKGKKKERTIKYSEISNEEIQKRIDFHDKLAHEIGKKIKPKLLVNLEESIRSDRERTFLD